MILRHTRVLLLAAPLALLIAPAGPAAAGESKSDKALLKAGVITKNDVPDGWTSKKATSSDRAYKGIAECKQLKAAIDNATKKVSRALSRDFEEPGSQGSTSAQDAVYVFKDVNAATNFLANYQVPDAATCLEKSVAKATSSRAGAGQPTLSPITNLEGVGDAAVGYGITIDLTAEGQTATVYIDYVLVQVGRAFIGFGFSNLDETLPGALTIIETVVDRVAQAQAST